MNYKIGVCKNCNKERLIVYKSKKLCFKCNNERIFEKRMIKIQPKLQKIEALKVFYEEFYRIHPTKTCFETGEKITNYKNWNCHHILQKQLYPQYMFNYDVCVLLTLDQHALYHNLPEKELETKMPNCYKKLQELKQKYNI